MNDPIDYKKYASPLADIRSINVGLYRCRATDVLRVFPLDALPDMRLWRLCDVFVLTEGEGLGASYAPNLVRGD